MFEKIELESDRMQEMATDCALLITVACLEQRSLWKQKTVENNSTKQCDTAFVNITWSAFGIAWKLFSVFNSYLHNARTTLGNNRTQRGQCRMTKYGSKKLHTLQVSKYFIIWHSGHAFECKKEKDYAHFHGSGLNGKIQTKEEPIRTWNRGTI